MLGQHRFDLLITRKPTLSGSLEPPIDACQLLGRSAIRAALEPGVDFTGNLGKLLLGSFRPCLHPRQDFLQDLRCHDGIHHTDLRNECLA